MDARLVLAGNRTETTKIEITPKVSVGDKQLLLIAGPCTVEDIDQLAESANALKGSVHALRGGAFKPSTSPYAFQGLREEGLQILADVSLASGLPVVTEVMSEQQVAIADPIIDVHQIGS